MFLTNLEKKRKTQNVPDELKEKKQNVPDKLKNPECS